MCKIRNKGSYGSVPTRAMYTWAHSKYTTVVRGADLVKTFESSNHEVYMDNFPSSVNVFEESRKSREQQ